MSLFSRRPALWLSCLLLTFALGCKKSADNATISPSPTKATLCQVQKSSNDAGEYELYTFDATGLITTIANYAKDQNGKIPTTVTPDRLSYNDQNLLDKITYGDGTGHQKYSYTNGALSKMELYKGGKVVYQYDVTTNANKRITALKSTNVANDPDYGSAYSTKYILDAQGRYTRMEAANADGVYYTIDDSAFDPTIQSPWKSLKGIPFYPGGAGIAFEEYGTYMPADAAAATKEVQFYGYDEKGKFIGLKKAFDVTITLTANSNNYETTRKDADAISGRTVLQTYQYSNCN